MSTHNVCFYEEIRKILSGYRLLSESMHRSHFSMTQLFAFSTGIPIMPKEDAGSGRESWKIFRRRRPEPDC